MADHPVRSLRLQIHATSPAEQKEMEKHFKMVGDDLVVLSADRVPIPVLVFLKGDAIELPAKPHQENKIKDVFEHSTRSLYSTDPSRKNFHPLIPTIPPKTDARHIHHAARREDFTEQEYGATYLIVQQEQGHDDRVCASGVILGEGARSMTGEEAEKEAQALAKRQAKKAGKRPPRKKVNYDRQPMTRCSRC